MKHTPTIFRRALGSVLFFGLILFFVWELISLQLVQGEAYFAQSQRNIARVETVEAARGQIVDRNGLVLVGNQPTWQISLDLSQMGDRQNDVLLTLMKLCEEEGISWFDSLPLSQQQPFVYSPQKEQAFDAFLNSKKTLKDLPPEEFLWKLSQEFQLSGQESPGERRKLCGVLYELALRRLGLVSGAYVFAEGISQDFFLTLKEHRLPGLVFVENTSRHYLTNAAAHLLGRVGPMDPQEWERFAPQGYPMNARVGKDGLERAFEEQLHGTPGQRVLELDTNGLPQNETYTTLPVPGKELRLTLDLPFQEAVEEILHRRIPQMAKAEGAAVAVLDVNDGGVLALASYPTYDLDEFHQNYPALLEDPLKPLLNRPLQGLYAPGSTFKMVTAVAGLQEGLITPKTKVLDTGRYTYYKNPQPRCWLFRQKGKTHGALTVSQAITESCNIFFYDLGRRLGIDTLARYALLFGLGCPTGIELPGEEIGVIAGPAYTRSLGQTWYDGSTLSAAIGQENNRFTPLQLASYTATIANGGQRFQVHLAKEIRSNDGTQSLVSMAPNVLASLSIDPKSLDAVKEGMLAVTQSGSVAGAFRHLPVAVAAKTGSAQVDGNEEANAVFVAFAPFENPQIALAIVVEKGDSGSALGAIAAEIIEAYVQQNT